MTGVVFWGMKELGSTWDAAINSIPLVGMLLMLRQQQAQHVENIMTLGDKEMIDELNKRGK